ncbi:hypothetical protein Golax_007346, partial [Gossypium laxum]|nr:hypothetical protein [Gossypium laxum]
AVPRSSSRPIPVDTTAVFATLRRRSEISLHHQCRRFCSRQHFMPSHAFLFFTAVLTDPAGHRCRVCHFPMTNEAQCLVSAVGSDWCILVVPLLRRGTGLLLSTFPPSFDNG